MRCSLCENLIDRYIEGTLPPARMQAVRAHLDSCPACEAIHRELRVVDGLLATTRDAELPPNFTFAVMAEARSMPVPVARRSTFWPALAGYLVAGWLAVAITAAAFAGKIPSLFQSGPVRALWGGLAAVGGALHSVGAAAPLAATVVVGVLCVDALLIAGIFYYYRRVRPQLAARFAVVEREAL